MQVAGKPRYTLFRWHEAQLVVMCAPVSGNAVVPWLKVAPSQRVVVWQVVQVVEKPAAACGGVVVPLKSVWWQEMQVVGLPR